MIESKSRSAQAGRIRRGVRDIPPVLDGYARSPSTFTSHDYDRSSRITHFPATITGKVLNYTDVDGDSVTIKFITRGELTSANAFFDTAFDSTGPQQLRFISFVGQTYAGTRLTMTVEQAGGGNGIADVGYIIGTGIDLGQIKLTGDLGGITAGDQDAAPGIVKLSVGPLGDKGNTTQGNVGHTHSAITGTAEHHVIIGARGQAKQGATADVAIRSIRVDGSMEFVDVLAGYLSPPFGSLNPFSPVNPDAQIGTIKVGQDLLSTNIVAGVRDVMLDGFGNGDDILIAGDTPDRIIASIARIEVGGTVNGTAGLDPEYGITAEWVKAFIIGGSPVQLTSGSGNDSLLAIFGVTTGDYRINEVG